MDQPTEEYIVPLITKVYIGPLHIGIKIKRVVIENTGVWRHNVTMTRCYDVMTLWRYFFLR